MLPHDDSLQAAIHEAVVLKAHDGGWAAAFQAERDRLQALLPGVFVQIEHVGSTSVEGMAAKPVIDILAGVESMATARSLSATLCDDLYTTSAEFNALLADRQWFMRWADGHRTHHLHVVVHAGEAWHDHIGFRDRLRSDPALRHAYATLKQRLAEDHADDREAYTAAKAGFIAEALRRAP